MNKCQDTTCTIIFVLVSVYPNQGCGEDYKFPPAISNGFLTMAKVDKDKNDTMCIKKIAAPQGFSLSLRFRVSLDMDYIILIKASYRGISRDFSLADRTLPTRPEPAWQKMARSPLNDTTQPVDSEEEGRSPTMGRRWLIKKEWG